VSKRATAFRAQADTSAIRTETFDGREYTVVPVVALVEGVIQSMNSPGPELVTVEAFGRFSVGWNGRPLVMSHPVDSNGDPVCANQPSVLEQYGIGSIFNTRVEDRKLKTEAWVDNERAAALNDESRAALEALQAGEVVEVSTGLYTTVVEKEGRFNGESYSGVWEGIVPDHLAILPAGVLGACSVEDGCGANRSSQDGAANVLTLKPTLPAVVGPAPTSTSSPFTAAEMRSNAWRNSIPKTHGCDCGGTCGHCGDQNMPEANSDATATDKPKSSQVQKRKSGKAITYPVGVSIGEVANGSIVPGSGGCQEADPNYNPINNQGHQQSFFTKLLQAAGVKVTPDHVRQAAAPPELDLAAFVASRIHANAAPGTMLSTDVSNLLREALSDAYSEQSSVSAYYMGHTADKVVYQAMDWNSANYYGDTFQCSYEISANGDAVTLGADDEEVNLITQVVRVADQVGGDADDPVRDQAANLSAPEGSEQESNDMTQNAAGGGTAPNNNADKKSKTVTETTDEATVHGDKGAVTQIADALDAGGNTGKAHSLEQLLDNAAPELRGAIKASMRLYANQKKGLIEGIKASGRNKFSDERLNAMEIDELEAIAELANVPRYDGIAPASAPQANQGAYERGQRLNNGLGVPSVEPAFPRKAANAA
jgi:hypothetical protein